MFQGLDKLKDPFLDTLSNYDESRQTVVELTWDQTQTDVRLILMTRMTRVIRVDH